MLNYRLHLLAAQYGWHHNKRYNLYQKVNGRVFVYVTPMLWGYAQVQLYKRGYSEMSVCKLELRAETAERYRDLFQVGEVWIQKYSSGDEKLMASDIYAVSNPKGVWGTKAEEGLYWIR
ncbi:hypothetical protein IAQ67_28630 (plasmid) [Paenibacillus peoriae]|uniref:Uncharacterized protein n=1 Tax=Paenibacillus peoriae TaxID=59893 RepID=A0A7H0YHC0_9BACL|nr:hypothetical protein [Paenibacillus peoriae]QNR70478.1 hypothetical protein IAQ67_28630 [Paenibacillus peoriae]